MKITCRFLLCLIAAVLFTSVVNAQTTSPIVATGTPPFNSFGGGPFDTVNLGNLNVHAAIGVRQKAGRGLPFSYPLAYDGSIWTPVGASGSQNWTPVNSATGGQQIYWGWTGLSNVGSGVAYVSYAMVYSSGTCGQFGNQSWQAWQYSNFVYHDELGIAHNLSNGGTYYNSPGGNACPPNGAQPPGTETGNTYDSSGYKAYVSLYAGYVSGYLTSKDGRTLYYDFVSNPPAQQSADVPVDANGNKWTVSNGTWTDTLGQTALTVAGSAPGNTTLSYTAPSGGTASYVVSYRGYTVKTAFNCSGIVDYTSASTVYLVDKITLPNSTFYQFAYENTPGYNDGVHVTARISQVTLPTGGAIAYQYTGGNNGINCSDGSAAGLTRTLNPGGTWTYARSGSGSAWTTTVTDPGSNQTVIQFQKDASSSPTYGFYETQRQVKQGSTVLSTTINCYNTANPTPSNCPGASVSSPISRVATFSYLPDTSGKVAETDTRYDTNSGYPTEVDSYDFGTGSPPSTPVQKVITAYNTYGSKVVPTSITVQDGNSTTKAYTTFSYDQWAPTATSGTPQHNTGVNYGNLTTVAKQVSGSVTLYQKFTYYDTGMLSTATDMGTSSGGGPNVTTYSYSGSSCGNSFPTSVSEPLTLTRSMAYDTNCLGGVLTSVTDENSQTMSTAYNDPYFWRLASSTDALSNTTSNIYTGATQVESYMNFSSSATSDMLVTADAIGRLVLSQKRQAHNSPTFDSTQTSYGWTTNTGRFTTVTVPYAAGAGQVAPGGTTVTTTQLDALGRIYSATDGGGGTVSYSYSQNDVLQTAGPTRTFQKQTEYDGLGRLSSVCEVSNTSGGNCGQTNAKTGFWTKYAYDVLGDLTSVTQNAQSGSQQTRAFTYDMLGRLLTEQNPESGTSTYIYDSWDGSCGSYTSAGNLVEKKDAVGNVTCMKYDALHRVTQITYPSGSYASRTPTKCFVYDSATVNGTAMGNAKTRLAEAYTTSASSCPGTPIVDEGFSYSARGETTDVWEKTPNSGTYYHPTAGYWANGALNTLWISSLPVITYNVDGEGRPSTVSANSGQNPVTLTNYNTAGQVTKVTFGSGDGDEFFYDGNTGRMTQYKFWANGSNAYGNLGWNANGTLGSLNITDPFNSGDNQNCSYAYDDLVRLSSVNCGSPWSQTFTYDAFGNVTKSGSISWQPGYNSSTNRYTLGGTSYDANGNLLNDTFHTYTWNSDSKPATIDSIGLTYDAFDRVVEQNQAGTYYQIVYTPMGTKMGKFKAGVIQQLYVPLPGGAQAEYYSWGLSNYRHADWLGSDRMQSDASTHAVTDNNAYGPFGEPYAQTGNGEISFTGQIKDTDWLQYDFLFRQYDPKQGRWISPDPAGLAVVEPTNPQSWNRYVYAVNNPLAMVDPLGLESNECNIGEWCWGPGGGGTGGDGGYLYLSPAFGAGDVMMNGMPASASLGQAALNSHFGVICRQCRPGATVGPMSANYVIFGWSTDTAGTHAPPCHPGNGSGCGTITLTAVWGPIGMGGWEDPTLPSLLPSTEDANFAFCLRYGDCPKGSATPHQPTGPEIYNVVNAYCTVEALNENNGLGIETETPGMSDSVATGISMAQNMGVSRVGSTAWPVTKGSFVINPGANASATLISPLSAPGIFVQGSWVGCMERHGQ